MAFENKNQILIIAGAMLAGVIAVVSGSYYIKTSIQNQTNILSQQYEEKQKELVSALQQRSDQQMAAMAQALQSVRREQAAAMQKQMTALQQAQAQAEQARMDQQRMQQAMALSQQSKKVRKPSVAMKTPKGKRAVTVMIDSLGAVGGLINEGDFVDVIAQLNVPSQTPEKKTVTAMIFQNLEVLAVNTNVDDPGDYDNQQASASLKITFAVDPQEAGLLTFADKNGTLELALRSPNENGRRNVKASTWKTLADYVLKSQGPNIQDPDGENANAKPAENKPSIQIFRAGKEL